MNDGRYALEAILETAKNYVGQDRKEDCEILLQELHTTIQEKHQLIPETVIRNRNSILIVFFVILFLGVGIGYVLWRSSSSLPPIPIAPEDKKSDSEMAYFESELWPGEGIPVFVSNTSHFTLYERPSLNAAIAREMDVERGIKIKFNRYRYRTIRPGKIITKSSGILVARSLSKISRLRRFVNYPDAKQKAKATLRCS